MIEKRHCRIKSVAASAIISLMSLMSLMSWFFILPGNGFAMEKLNDAELQGIHAQSGISVAVNNVPLYYANDSFKVSAIDNVDLFGTPTPYEGYAALEDFKSLSVMDGEFHLDVGMYQAPDEHLLATDINKNTYLFAGDDLNKHWYVTKGKTYPKPDPYYWLINDDMERPLDGNIAVLQTSTTINSSLITSTSGIRFCDKDLGDMSLSGIVTPEFIHDDEYLPGKVMTVYPGETSGVNMEIRTRLTVDNFSLQSSGASSNPDIEISGIHLGETFSFGLPSHVEDTGSEVIDTSGWGSDFSERMHRGYFLLGNLNQVDYTDNIQERELWYGLINGTYYKPDGITITPVPLVANPLSLNFVSKDDRSFISLSTGLDGSIRIESIKGWDGGDLGPLAVDGMKIKHCVLEFPGGHTWSDGSFKGRIHPDQVDWLNNL